MKTRLMICASAVWAATALLAHEGVKDPDVMKRMNAMQDVAQNMKALAAIVKDPSRFDAAAIRLHSVPLADHARSIAPLFEYQATDPKSEARDAIWANWPGFLEEATAMEKAAEALSGVTSQDAFEAAFTALGDTCTSCHKTYRIKN